MLFLTRRTRFLLITGALLLMACAQVHAARLALVIGNRDYTSAPLANPINDAQAVDAALRGVGFETVLVRNLKRDQIGRTIEGFLARVRKTDDVVVFYAGHGVQVKGVNYLPAVDANIHVESDVALSSIDLNQLLERLDEATTGVKLMMVDACRDNPYSKGFRSASRGLASVKTAPSGILLHFATRPGGVAADGSGRNGLYTSHLLKHLKTPDLSVESMLKRVAAGVRDESGGQQQPWTEGALDGEFYFVNSRTVAGTPSPQAVAPPAASGGTVPPAPPAAVQAPPAEAQVAALTPPAARSSPEWLRPTNGPVLKPYGAGPGNGIIFGGQPGDPVVAVADGTVVYAGSGLRGFGNLVILRHAGNYLSSYAHNRSLLVRESAEVKRGQVIAELGSSEATQNQLSFEIRLAGRPIDPTPLIGP